MLFDTLSKMKKKKNNAFSTCHTVEYLAIYEMIWYENPQAT